MPLKRGSSSKTISSNVSEIMNSYKKTKKIGTSKPKGAKKAQKQAVAIALSKAREIPTPNPAGKVTYVKKRDGNKPVKIS